MSSGRPPSTSHDEVERVALELFSSRGFDQTTVEDIAAAVGVGRRTIFRYFPSKNDMVWGDFDWVLERLREGFAAAGDETPLMQALRLAVVNSNSYDAEQLPGLRIRMTLITTVPALQAHSMLRYEAWRAVVAEYAAARLGEAADDLIPQAIAHAALGTSMAAFKRWVENPDEDLAGCLDRAYRELASGFAVQSSPA
jgi:TetR/AcrR family transcriptional regulator, regulator of mycofactocin system